MELGKGGVMRVRSVQSILLCNPMRVVCTWSQSAFSRRRGGKNMIDAYRHKSFRKAEVPALRAGCSSFCLLVFLP